MAGQADMVKREQATPENTREQAPGTRRVMPLVDVYENDDQLLLLADMPGVDPDDLELRLEEGELSIRGTQHQPEGANDSFVPLEFIRVFSVSPAIAPDKVTAELKAGVLRVELGKTEAAKPKRIQIQSG